MSRRRRTDPQAERPVHRVRAGTRRGNRVFYVAVEGESTEPDYLSYLNRAFGAEHGFLIHILSERNGLKPRDVVARAARHRNDGGELWALFDRDQHEGVPEAFAAARQHDVAVAFSHPSFDLWLLLHFAPFGGRQDGSNHVVLAKLRRWPGFANFGVRDKRLDTARCEALRGRERDATRNARTLAADCALPECSAANGHADHCPPWRQDPSCGVWRLLVALRVVDPR